MRNIKSIYFISLLFLTIQIYGQKTATYSDPYLSFKKGKDFYDQGLFQEALKQFEIAKSLAEPLNESSFKSLDESFRFYAAHCALILDYPEGEKEMKAVAIEYNPSPISNKAMFVLGDYYYNQRQYQNAIDYYSQLNTNDFTVLENSEARFKQGYCHFVLKEFEAAELSLAQTISLQNEFYFPSNY
ncbi:MAG: tetratricopeptide repeat protein, partial [Bacteroidota bacterium]